MSATRKIAISLFLIFFLPLVTSNFSFSEEIFSPVSAASCNSSNREPIWGTEAANISVRNNMYDYKLEDSGNEPYPEYEDSVIYSNEALGTLTQDDDFSTSQVMANDSISGLRLNLTTGQKYTFCVTAQHLNNGTILGSSNVDVYLLTSYDWDIYERDYNQRNSEWRDYLMDDVPIEWRSYMSSFYWKPYRDVHEYTENSQFEFSVALDQPLVTNSMWQEYGSSWEEFYLIVDGWDNIYEDAKAPGHEVQVDIQVMIEERYALPNWTVSLTCCGLFLSIAAIPAILHVRYQKAGISSENSQLIPKVSGTDTNAFGTMKEELE